MNRSLTVKFRRGRGFGIFYAGTTVKAVGDDDGPWWPVRLDAVAAMRAHERAVAAGVEGGAGSG